MKITIKTNNETKTIELSYTDLLTGLYTDLMYDEIMPDNIKTPACNMLHKLQEMLYPYSS